MQKHKKQILGLSGLAFVAITTSVAHSLPPVSVYANSDSNTRLQVKYLKSKADADIALPSPKPLNPSDVKISIAYNGPFRSRYKLRKKSTGAIIPIPKNTFNGADSPIQNGKIKDTLIIPNLDDGKYILEVEVIDENGVPKIQHIEFTVDRKAQKLPENTNNTTGGYNSSSNSQDTKKEDNDKKTANDIAKSDNKSSLDNNGTYNSEKDNSPYKPGGNESVYSHKDSINKILDDIKNQKFEYELDKDTKDGQINGISPFHPYRPYNPADKDNPSPSNPYNPFNPYVKGAGGAIFDPKSPDSVLNKNSKNSPLNPKNANYDPNFFSPNNGKHFVVPRTDNAKIRKDKKTGNPIMSISFKPEVCLVKVQAYSLPALNPVFNLPVAFKTDSVKGTHANFALDFASFGAKSGEYSIVTTTFLKDSKGNCSVFYPIPSMFTLNYKTKGLNVPNTGVISFINNSFGKASYVFTTAIATMIIAALFIIRKKFNKR